VRRHWSVERLLAKGYEVRALTRKTSDSELPYRPPKPRLSFARPPEYDSLGAGGTGSGTSCVHCAAKVTPLGPWSEFRAITVEGTKNMLRLSGRGGVKRFLQVSSGPPPMVTAGPEEMSGGDENTPCEAREDARHPNLR